MWGSSWISSTLSTCSWDKRVAGVFFNRRSCGNSMMAAVETMAWRRSGNRTTRCGYSSFIQATSFLLDSHLPSHGLMTFLCRFPWLQSTGLLIRTHQTRLGWIGTLTRPYHCWLNKRVFCVGNNRMTYWGEIKRFWTFQIHERKHKNVFFSNLSKTEYLLKY